MLEIALATALLLGGIVATGPASARLARACWPSRAPRPALVLWQALCLGAGLSFIGAPLVVALHPLGPDLPAAAWTFLGNLFSGNALRGLGAVNIAGGLLAVGIAGLLTVALAVSFYRTLRRRRAHREVIDLLASVDPESGTVGVSVLDHPSAVAYTLPGWHARVVLSAGLLELLETAEIESVIEHEQAHLSLRDDLVQLPFQTWAAGLGPVPGVRQARRAVAELAEMLADDIAAQRCDPAVLAGALAKVAIAGAVGGRGDGGNTAGLQSPAVGSSIAGSTGEGSTGAVLARVERLLAPRPLGRPRRIAVYVLAASLIAVPTALLLSGWS